MKSMFAAVVVFAGLTGPAAAQAPVAVVEDVQGTVTGVEFMDYVAPGEVIKLGPNGAVVLGYMKILLARNDHGSRHRDRGRRREHGPSRPGEGQQGAVRLK
jgi:hypothetical protein